MNLSYIRYQEVRAEHQEQQDDPTAEIRWIDRLPRDLIIEILSRLTAKNLCKLRCISKSWLDLLSRDKEFLSRHIQRSKLKNPLLLIRRYYTSNGMTETNGNSQTTIELTSIDAHGDTTDEFTKKIDGPVKTFFTCGSLALFSCMSALYICNPSMRQVVRVPPGPNTDFHNVGFGYLPEKNEYKVVHLFYRYSDWNEKMGCEIFSFESGERVSSGYWGKIEDCPFSGWVDGHPVCAKGFMYWALSSGWEDKSILCFDLEKQKFSRVCYPILDHKRYSVFECVGLVGSLHVVGFSADEPKTIDIWSLKEDKRKKGWRIVSIIDVSPLCPKFLVPICDGESKEILVHMSEKYLISCDVRSGMWRRVDYYKAIKSCNKPNLYYDSLVPL